MKFSKMVLAIILFGACFSGVAVADSYSITISVFKQSEAVQPFFENCYGYAVFPTVGKGGVGIGGAYGKGKVYRGGKVTGET